MAIKEKKEVDGIKVIDESGDKRYFTIIPNCVVNGSGVYERAMYMEMKRFAGETGTCFASIRSMAKRCNIGTDKVTETIKKLIKRGWIERAGTQSTGGNPVNCYRIVDVWELNMKTYREKKERKST